MYEEYTNQWPEIVLSVKQLRDKLKAVLNPEYIQRYEDSHGKLWEKDSALLTDLAKDGFLTARFPEEFGGIGASIFQAALLEETAAEAWLSLSLFFSTKGLVGEVLNKFGTNEQKAYWFPIVAKRGENFCLTESIGGSNAGRLKMSAKKIGDKYILNGRKIFITGNRPGAGLVFARIQDPIFGDAIHAGITAFLVDMNYSKIEIIVKNKTGMRGSPTCEITFDDVEVPEKNIIGQIGKGYMIALWSLARGRAFIGAQSLGALMQGLNLGFKHIKEHVIGDKPLIQYQTVKSDFADIIAETVAGFLFLRRVCKAFDDADGKALGEEPIAQLNYLASAMKLYGSEAAFRGVKKIATWFGGSAFLEEHQISRLNRDVDLIPVYEGASPVQRERVIEWLRLGFLNNKKLLPRFCRLALDLLSQTRREKTSEFLIEDQAIMHKLGDCFMYISILSEFINVYCDEPARKYSEKFLNNFLMPALKIFDRITREKITSFCFTLENDYGVPKRKLARLALQSLKTQYIKGYNLDNQIIWGEIFAAGSIDKLIHYLVFETSAPELDCLGIFQN